jgi:hypothetical protein
MDVGDENVGHIHRIQAEATKTGENMGHRGVGSHVDEPEVAAVAEEVAGKDAGAYVMRVENANAEGVDVRGRALVRIR